MSDDEKSTAIDEIKQEARGASSDYFSAYPDHGHPSTAERQVPLRGWGHALYSEDRSASHSHLTYDPAHTFHPQAPATAANCRGHEQALQGAQPPSKVLIGNDHASPASEELRCEVLESEVKRLKYQLLRKEEDLRLKNEEVHRFRRELASSRCNIEDLQDTLRNQKDLINVYHQLVLGTNQIKDLVSQVESLPMTDKRPQLPQPTPAAKRTRLESISDLPTDQISSNIKDALKWLSGDASRDDTFNLSKRPRYSSEHPTSQSSHRPASNRITLRRADLYDPPYAPRKQDIGRYVPTPRPNPWSADKHTPSAPKALLESAGAPASIGMTVPSKLEVPRAVLKPSSTNIAPNAGGQCHPSRLKGDAPDAFLRAQRLGVPYDPAKHVGIPSQCTVCLKTLPSKKKLDRHMLVSHGSRRGPPEGAPLAGAGR
ncbi:MAG: hypothetical protein Q9195_005228 [Heterodermia aff. obscurata]